VCAEALCCGMVMQALQVGLETAWFIDCVVCSSRLFYAGFIDHGVATVSRLPMFLVLSGKRVLHK